MKYFFQKFIAAVLFLIIAQSNLSAQVTLMNNDWLFHKGDIANAPDNISDTVQWRNIALPHDWSIEGPFGSQWASGTGYLPAGIGWYKKYFVADKNWQNKNIAIYFDGVYKNSEVWINGHYLGKRPNGFISFYYDLTPYLNFKEKNYILVKVDHTEFADSRWYTGSGIYRNVYLIAKEPLHIKQWGVKFSCKNISENHADAHVKLAVQNNYNTAKTISAVVKLIDKSGNKVAEQQKTFRCNAVTDNVSVFTFKVNTPHLWSVDTPDLYTLNVTLKSDGKIMDSYNEKVGIRSIRFDAEKGFFLNDKNVKLKGVCIHDDAGVLGVAVPEEAWIRRLRYLKAAGCNAIRMSHNPHVNYLYDMCDEMGFLIMDEAFDEWEEGKNKWVEAWNEGTPAKFGYHSDFKENAMRDVQDMVLRNQNKCSIIMWSIGNEIDYPNDPYTHPILDEGKNPQIYGEGYSKDNPPAERLSALSKQLVDYVKKIDTTRYVTAALAAVTMSNFTDYPSNIDVVGYNYQEYRYAEDHKKYPNRIIYGSENGKQYSNWKAVTDNDFIAGQFLWAGIDFLGEARAFPNRNSTAGIMNAAGFPKQEYYYRQALWSSNPMLYAGVADMDEKNNRNFKPTWTKLKGDSVKIKCFTNCDEVEMFVNNNSLGRKKMAESVDAVLSWNAKYEHGKLEAKGYKNGKQMVDTVLLSAGKAEILQAYMFEDPLIDRKKTHVEQIEIVLKDKNGNIVFDAGNEITVKVSGTAVLLGLENGDANDINSYHQNKMKAMNGRLLAFVRVEGSNKKPEVEISSEGMKPVRLYL
jgi:beta-galactosidase/beta-glucuronidase